MRKTYLVYLGLLLAPIQSMAEQATESNDRVLVSQIDGEEKKSVVVVTGSTVGTLIKAISEARKDQGGSNVTKFFGENIECSELDDGSGEGIAHRCKFVVDTKGHVTKPDASSDKNVITTLPTGKQIAPKFHVIKVKDSDTLTEFNFSSTNGGSVLSVAKELTAVSTTAGPHRNQSTLKGEQIACVITRAIAPNERTGDTPPTSADLKKAKDGDGSLESIVCSFYVDKKGNVTAPKI